VDLFADLKVTDIKRNSKSFDFILNGDLKICGAVLKNNDIIFPKYANKEKTYVQFKILKRSFRQYIISSLSSETTSAKTEKISFKINKFSILKNHKNIKSFASVIFNDDIEVECRIMQSNNKLWIAYPSNKINGNWINNFEILNGKLKKNLEKTLIGHYETKRLKNNNQQFIFKKK
jgi:DNA-binding cell septation regulator SpoVG